MIFKKKLSGSTQIWTGIVGFKVQSDNRYTIEPHCCFPFIFILLLLFIFKNKDHEESPWKSSKIKNTIIQIFYYWLPRKPQINSLDYTYKNITSCFFLIREIDNIVLFLYMSRFLFFFHLQLLVDNYKIFNATLRFFRSSKNTLDFLRFLFSSMNWTKNFQLFTRIFFSQCHFQSIEHQLLFLWRLFSISLYYKSD